MRRTPAQAYAFLLTLFFLVPYAFPDTAAPGPVRSQVQARKKIVSAKHSVPKEQAIADSLLARQIWIDTLAASLEDSSGLDARADLRETDKKEIRKAFRQSHPERIQDKSPAANGGEK